jgi:hypothetical protein
MTTQLESNCGEWMTKNKPHSTISQKAHMFYMNDLYMNKKEKQRGKIKLLLSTIQQRSSTFQSKRAQTLKRVERGKGLGSEKQAIHSNHDGTLELV